MSSPRRLVVAVLGSCLALVAAACGGGGPSRDDFQDAANTICADSNDETQDLDDPAALDDAVEYADDAKEIVNDRILALEDVEVQGDDESDFEDYLDALVEERQALIDLSEADPESDDLETLIEDVERSEKDSIELADDLGLDDCGDAEEGQTVALALDAQPEPEPEPNPDDPDEPEPGPDEPEPAPEGGELGSDPIAAVELLGLPQGPAYSGEEQDITDDSGTLTMTVPVEWIDVDGSPADDGSFNLDATPDIDQFLSGFTVPGALFAATADPIDINALLGQFTPEACTPIGQGDYSDPAYTGRFQLAVDCADTATAVLVVAANADDGTHNVLVQIGITSVQDIAPAERVLNTFVASGGGF